MVETADAELFRKTQRDVFKKSFEDIEADDIFEKKPLIFCHFAAGLSSMSLFLVIFCYLKPYFGLFCGNPFSICLLIHTK